MSFDRVVSQILPVTLLTFPLAHCSGSPPDSPVLIANMPLHLEEPVAATTIVGSDVPADLPRVGARVGTPHHPW